MSNKDTNEDTEEIIEEKEKKGLERIKEIFGLLQNILGVGTSQSRLAPILSPIDYRTSTKITKGEINMLVAFLVFAEESPYECESMIDFCENFCLLNISHDGFGIEKGIDLAKAFSDVKVSASLEKQPDKPTEGMKE